MNTLSPGDKVLYSPVDSKKSPFMLNQAPRYSMAYLKALQAELGTPEGIEQLLTEFVPEDFSDPDYVRGIKVYLENMGRSRITFLESMLLHPEQCAGFCEALKQFPAALIEKIKQELVFSSGGTILHIAAYTDCVELIELFATSDTDINRPNNHCETPAYSAIIHGHWRAFDAFGKRGAKLESVLTRGEHLKNLKFSFPFFVAIDYGALAIKHPLLRDGTSYSACDALWDKVPTMEQTSWLIVAAQSGNLKKLEEGLINNPDYDLDEAVGEEGATALIIAVQHGHIRIVEFLLRAGADGDGVVA